MFPILYYQPATNATVHVHWSFSTVPIFFYRSELMQLWIKKDYTNCIVGVVSLDTVHSWSLERTTQVLYFSQLIGGAVSNITSYTNYMNHNSLKPFLVKIFLFFYMLCYLFCSKSWLRNWCNILIFSVWCCVLGKTLSYYTCFNFSIMFIINYFKNHIPLLFLHI